MNDILARRARRATMGIALSAALVAGIAPVTAIAAETSAPTGAVALQTEDAAAAKEKAYAAMQEALKNLEAAKDAAGPEILETIEHVITDLQSLRDRMLKELVAMGEDMKIPFNEEQYKTALPLIKTQVKALLARDIWDMSEYFQVINTLSDSMRKAVELLSEPGMDFPRR